MDVYHPQQRLGQEGLSSWVYRLFIVVIWSRAMMYVENWIRYLFWFPTNNTVTDGNEVPPGFPNLGNTCYMASVLQALRIVFNGSIGSPSYQKHQIITALKQLYTDNDFEARTKHTSNSTVTLQRNLFRT
jgi:ubiquitin C-terminal hydrolase